MCGLVALTKASQSLEWMIKPAGIAEIPPPGRRLYNALNVKTHYKPQQVVQWDCTFESAVCVRACACPSACVQIARRAMNHIMSKSVKIKHKRIIELGAEQSMSNQCETWVAVSTEGLHTELTTSLILQG